MGLEGAGDWGKVPATIPVIIFSLVYHDLAPGKNTKKLLTLVSDWSNNAKRNLAFYLADLRCANLSNNAEY